jgi:hypothetical protein
VRSAKILNRRPSKNHARPLLPRALAAMPVITAIPNQKPATITRHHPRNDQSTLLPDQPWAEAGTGMIAWGDDLAYHSPLPGS